MSDDKRDALRARVQASSKDEVVLEEMIRRGFWRDTAGAPSLPAELIRRQGEIRRELEGLATEAASYTNSEQALKRVQAERMKEAKARRLETKQRRAERRHERAIAWHKRQAAEITHLGDDVSAALHGKDANAEKLAEWKLPAIPDAAALAQRMGIKLGELRFLAYDRKVATVDHYARFTIPKKTGGVREISAPMPRLKRAQYWILGNVLGPLIAHEAAHGFRAGRSIITNANPHVGRRVVINIDLKDFFPTISYGRVKGFFVSLGYAEKVAAPLALICTDAERDKLQIDGRVWNVARGQRRLPQGAPTSPAIANLIANRLDRRMVGAARKLGFTYTRYADDMTFSGDVEPRSVEVGRLLWQLRKIAEDEGFTFNDKKTRIMGSGTRQDVTGLVVNKRPAVARDERRRFRAWLHQAELAKRAGAPIEPWTNAKGVMSDARGYVGYLAMINPKTGADLKARTAALFASFKTPRTAKAAGMARAEFRKAAAEGRAPRETWWTPADQAEPKLEVFVAPGAAKSAASATSSGAWGQSNAATSVPGVSRQTRAAQSSASQPPTPAGGRSVPPLWRSIVLSIAALALLVVPGLGVLLLGAALYFIWRMHWRT